jgi:hypothetical protein
MGSKSKLMLNTVLASCDVVVVCSMIGIIMGNIDINITKDQQGLVQQAAYQEIGGNYV